jgi:hypothetical protein
VHKRAGDARDPKGWHSRGYLPHLDAPGTVQHVIFRVADSLPRKVLESLDAARANARMRAQTVDGALDRGEGACHLADPRIAEIVEDALLRFDGERYRLIAWCVMPNHVHVVIETTTRYSLGCIVHAWKSFTAKGANRVLGRGGRSGRRTTSIVSCATTGTSPPPWPMWSRTR